jgi:hypothetical protein
MNTRVRRLTALLSCLGLSTLLVVDSCSNEHLVSISVTPQNASVTQTGDTTQFQAIGTTNHVAVPPETLTSGVTWSSSTASVATITSTGLATAVGCGTTTITAHDGSLSGLTQFTNSCAGSGGGNPILESINLYPNSLTIPQIGQTSQFIALGVYAPAATNNNLSSVATWGSSDTAIATISSTGLATAVSCGTTTITAQYLGITGQALLNVSCGSITSIELLVVKTGTPGTTILSAPAGISCGIICGALFNEGTGITLTATSPASSWTGCDQISTDKTTCYFTLVPDPGTPTQKQVTAAF